MKIWSAKEIYLGAFCLSSYHALLSDIYWDNANQFQRYIIALFQTRRFRRIWLCPSCYRFYISEGFSMVRVCWSSNWNTNWRGRRSAWPNRVSTVIYRSYNEGSSTVRVCSSSNSNTNWRGKKSAWPNRVSIVIYTNLSAGSSTVRVCSSSNSNTNWRGRKSAWPNRVKTLKIWQNFAVSFKLTSEWISLYYVMVNSCSKKWWKYKIRSAMF